MKKILIVSTVSRQFYLFEQGNIETLKELGYEVHVAANFSDANERLNVLEVIRHPFDIQRSPFSSKNVTAFKQLKRIMSSVKFDAVHCHSPMGGVLARLTAKSTGVSPVIYTAHGFHFYKGAPLINWLLYYPIEKILARYTDLLITINREDYGRAKSFKARKVAYTPGVGVDIMQHQNLQVNENKREELAIPQNALVILSVGELNSNKNHESIIKAMKKIRNSNVYYIICGQGDKEEHLKNLSNVLGLSARVKLLGYRNDIPEIYKIANIFAFPSYREGLSLSLMEAMASGLPVVCSSIRGNIDLIDNEKGGYLIPVNNIEGYVEALDLLLSDDILRKRMGDHNLQKIQSFDIKNIKLEMMKLYKEL